MKINGITRAMEVYGNSGQNKAVGKTEKAGKSDELELSSTAKDYQFAMAELKKIPDIRGDKVSAIKQKLDAGTYKVDSKSIASKIYNAANGIEE